MKTAIGAPDPNEFYGNQPHNIFNDRRISGKSKNRAVGESLYNPKMVKKERPLHSPDKWSTGKPKPKPSNENWR
jgi:hypothetical protein